MDVLSADDVGVDNDDDDGGCGGVVACPQLPPPPNDDMPLIDGDRGTSNDAFKDAVELPYNKLTKFKLCADELDDSSASFMTADVGGLVGVFDRFA